MLHHPHPPTSPSAQSNRARHGGTKSGSNGSSGGGGLATVLHEPDQEPSVTYVKYSKPQSPHDSRPNSALNDDHIADPLHARQTTPQRPPSGQRQPNSQATAALLNVNVPLNPRTHMDVVSASTHLPFSAPSATKKPLTWQERQEKLPPSPKLSYIKQGGLPVNPLMVSTMHSGTVAPVPSGSGTRVPLLISTDTRERENATVPHKPQTPRAAPSPRSRNGLPGVSSPTAAGVSVRPTSSSSNQLSPLQQSPDEGVSPWTNDVVDEFSATEAILSALSGDSPREQMEVDRRYRERMQEKLRSSSRGSNHSRSSSRASTGPAAERSDSAHTAIATGKHHRSSSRASPATERSDSAHAAAGGKHHRSSSRADAAPARSDSAERAVAVASTKHHRSSSRASPSLPPSSIAQPSHAQHDSFDIAMDEFGDELQRSSSNLVDTSTFPPKPSDDGSVNVRDEDEESDEDDDDEGNDAFDGHKELPISTFSHTAPINTHHIVPVAPVIREKYEEEDSPEESKENLALAQPPVQPYPVDPKSMKASHRLILERLYGTQHAKKVLSSDGSQSARPSTTPRSKRAAPKLLALTDGLSTTGSFALGGGSLGGSKNGLPLSARPSTSASSSLSHSLYSPSRSQSFRRPRTVELTSRSSTPRVTQVANLKRLTLGQSVTRVAADPTKGTDGEKEGDWSYLTTVRKDHERLGRIRDARIAVATASRSAQLAPPAEWTLEEQERLKQVELDKAMPLYQRQGVALPSSKKSRRPPAQSSFRDVSLTDGILAKIVRTSNLHYRLSAAVPGSLTLAHEPRLVAWRLDTNAWLTSQQRYVSKQVSVNQLGELRVLYDALDDDGSDSLDAGELATAMRVCGIREEDCKPLAAALLEWMGKSRFECLSFAEFAYAVLHYNIPVTGRGGAVRAVFGQAQRMQPLFTHMMQNDNRSSFSQVVLEFKRHRLYEAMQKTTGIDMHMPE